MMMYPDTLPSPLLRGFRRQRRENKSTFNPQGGQPRTVVFYTAVPEILTMSLHLTVEQKQIFEQFYKDTLFGTQLFEWVDPEDGSVAYYRFVGSPPNYQAVGLDYRVNFQLEKQV